MRRATSFYYYLFLCYDVFFIYFYSEHQQIIYLLSFLNVIICGYILVYISMSLFFIYAHFFFLYFYVVEICSFDAIMIYYFSFYTYVAVFTFAVFLFYWMFFVNRVVFILVILFLFIMLCICTHYHLVLNVFEGGVGIAYLLSLIFTFYFLRDKKS